MSQYSSIPTADPVESGETMVEVVCPASLGEGYTFDALYEGVVFPVTVPPGGVKEGQKITVPFIPPSDSRAAVSSVGVWKDGLCECCNYGPFHPAFLCACCCQPCGMAQVMTRLKLNMCGTPASGDGWRNTYRNVFIFVVIYYIISLIITPTPLDPEVTYSTEEVLQFESQSTIANLVEFFFFLYITIALCRTRYAVREKYHIAESSCPNGTEDCICACCCACCVTAQLARQTADYDSEEARCCSKTGLAESTPVIVV